MAWDRIVIDADGTTLEFILDDGTTAHAYMLSDGRVWYIGEVTPIRGMAAEAQGPIAECDAATVANIHARIRELARRNTPLAALLQNPA